MNQIVLDQIDEKFSWPRGPIDRGAVAMGVAILAMDPDVALVNDDEPIPPLVHPPGAYAVSIVRHGGSSHGGTKHWASPENSLGH